MRNPSLASFELEVRARDARMFQAGLYPNPEIEIEIENFGGSGPLSGFSGTETTIQFNQPIPLAGKISKEVNALTLERDVARWEYHIRKLDLINEVRKAFIDVLFAQERLKLIKEMVRLAEEFLKTATERVKVGKASPNRKNKGENCTIDKQNRT
jgi:cobalt-zinc-cadmium efflux system outer membrane protein